MPQNTEDRHHHKNVFATSCRENPQTARLLTCQKYGDEIMRQHEHRISVQVLEGPAAQDRELSPPSWTAVARKYVSRFGLTVGLEYFLGTTRTGDHGRNY